MAEVRRIPELGNLSKVDVWLILTLIIEYEGKFDLVKSEWKNLTSNDIDIKIIQQLAAKYDGRMAAMKTKYEDEILRNPLASRGARLRILFKVVKDALRMKDRGSYKSGKDAYEIRNGMDYTAIINAVMGAERICDNAEKRRIDWAKLQGSAFFGQDEDNSPVEDGLESMEDVS
jgi:hypothetical protein